MAQSLEDEAARNKRRWDEHEAISHMVPGHRLLYKQAGVTKLQVRIGRTKGYRLTPEQEHKERDGSVPGPRKKNFEKLELNKEKMKELMDWLWNTRRDRSGDDKKWAPAAEIPRQFRPKLNQISQFDWQNMNPYPGWMLAIEQGGAGCKCKLMDEGEFNKFEEGEKSCSKRETLSLRKEWMQSQQRC